MRTRYQLVEAWNGLKSTGILLQADGDEITYLPMPNEDDLHEYIDISEELASLTPQGDEGEDASLDCKQISKFLARLLIRKQQVDVRNVVKEKVDRIKSTTVPDVLSTLLRNKPSSMSKLKLTVTESRLSNWKNNLIKLQKGLAVTVEELRGIADDRGWPEHATLKHIMNKEEQMYAEPAYSWSICGSNLIDEDILSVIEKNAIAVCLMDEVELADSHAIHLLSICCECQTILNTVKEGHHRSDSSPVSNAKDSEANSSDIVQASPMSEERPKRNHGTDTTLLDTDSVSGEAMGSVQSSDHNSSIGPVALNLLSETARRLTLNVRGVVKSLRRYQDQAEADQDLLSDKLFRNAILCMNDEVTRCELEINRAEQPPDEAYKWLDESLEIVKILSKKCREADAIYKKAEHDEKEVDLNSKNLAEFNGNYGTYITWKRQVLETLKSSNKPRRLWKMIVSNACFKKVSGGSTLNMINRAITETTCWEDFIDELDSYFGEPSMVANYMGKRIERIKRPSGNGDPLAIEMLKSILAIDTDLEACEIKEMVIQKSTVEDLFDKLPPVVKDHVSERKYLKKPVEIWNIIIEGFKKKKYYLMANRDTFYTLHKGKTDDMRNQEKKRETGTVSSTKLTKTSAESKENITRSSSRMEVEQKKNFDPCYLCGEGHAVWARSCTMTGNNLTPEAFETLVRLKVCLRCGRKEEHCKDGCNGKYKSKDGKIKTSDCSQCKDKIHFRLCKCNYKTDDDNETKAGCVTTKQYVESQSVAQVEDIVIIDPETKESVKATVQYDSGSQRSWVQADFYPSGEYEKTEHLTVQGFAGTVSEENDYDVFSYLVDVHGTKKRMELTKFERLAGVPNGSVKIPQQWKNKFKVDNYDVKAARVDILLGADYQGLHPQPVETLGNLVLFKSQLTTNYMIAGSAKKMETVTCKPVQIQSDAEKHKKFMEVLTCENLDFSEKRHKKQLEKEDQDLYASLEHKDGKWYANYNYYENLKNLMENRCSAERMMTGLLAKLKKKPELKPLVIEQIKGNLERKHWVPVSDLSLEDTLQRHYLPWNIVISEKSTSTPIRLVTNSSNKDANGLSLNDCQVQGTSDIGDLRKVLIILRTAQRIAIGDLSKYFNSFQLPNEDISLRRLLIPESLVPDKWNDRIAQDSQFLEVVEASMPFGDSAAAWLAVLGRVKNAEEFAHLVPEYEERVLTIYVHQSYVDDCVVTGKWEEDLQPLMTAMRSVAEAGGFAFKEFNSLGDDKIEKVLGYLWNCKDDTLALKNWFNLGRKDRGKKLDKDLTPESVRSEVMKSFTKKDAISCQAQVFDPMGLYLPMTIKLRLFYGEVCLKYPGQSKDSWSMQLDDNLKEKFINIFLEFWKAKEVEFPRTTVPRNILQGERVDVMLATFCDGGEKAYSACIYLVTRIDDGFESHLLQSIAKTAGTKRLSIPRLELLGAELGVKLWKKSIESLPKEINVTQNRFFSDSTTVLRQLNCHSGAFNVFVGTRTQYIQSETDIADWKHIPSDQNPADLASKDKATVEDLASAKWMNGQFLTKPEEEWPTRAMDQLPGKPEPLPDLAKGYSTAKEVTQSNKVIVNRVVTQVKTSQEQNRDEMVRSIVENSRSWDAALGICALVLKAVERFKTAVRKDDNSNVVPAPVRFFRAKKMLLQSSMDETKQLLKTSKLTSYQIEEGNDRILYAIGRTLESVGERKVPLISGGSKVGTLILSHWHDMWGHGHSVKRVESKLREKFYIPFAQKRLEKIRKECFTCKKLDMKNLPQKMGPLPESRYSFTKPFHSVQVDIAGPFTVRDAVKLRVKLKHWLFCATCESTRATFACAMEDYGASSVLSALSNLKSQHGSFKFVHSDLGSNLVKAGKVLETMFEEVKKGVTRKYPEVEWSFGPGKAPWVQGTVEAIIKLLKTERKREQLMTGQRVLTSLQFDQVVRGWANMVNKRPLVYNPEIGQALTPNHLLHGRSDDEQDEELQVSGSLLKRHKDVQDQMKCWWEVYNECVRRDRLQKWRKTKENLEEGDIVWLLDTPSRTGFYKLGKVIKASPSSDGLVRRATVRYFNSTDKLCHAETVERHANTLVLVEKTK